MKRHPETLTFARTPILRAQFVRAVCAYEGLRYEIGSTFVERDDNGEIKRDENGKPVGHGNCYGILFLGIKDCGLWDGDANCPPSLYDDQIVGKTLVEVLDYNFDRLPPQGMKPGDILSLRYLDTSARNREPHHVGMVIEPPDGWRKAGRFIHASQAEGKVVIQEFDTLFMGRIESVYSLKNFQD